MTSKPLLHLVLFCTYFGIAQQPKPNDSIITLNEVTISGDRLLKSFSKTQLTQNITEKQIKRSGASLTELLRQNASIYFKENGFGMVSSPAFRGTTAQQTAVVWNGININSQFNGLTDFNTINPQNFKNITVKSGGGSVIYGSGAIGGSIHLTDNIVFKIPFEQQFFANFGSFNSQALNYSANYGSDTISVGVAVSHNTSDNDYPFQLNNENRVNQNGQFFNTSLSSQLGFKLHQKHRLKLYSYVFSGSRNFALIQPSETPTKYTDFNTRQLLEWESKFGAFTSVLRGAYLTEHYKFFNTLSTNAPAFGKAETGIGNYQLSYKPNKNTQLLAVADVNSTTGNGSNISSTTRTITSFSVLANQRFKKLYYEAVIRQEFTNAYQSPLLFSLGLNYQFSPWYTLAINGSKNFRIPTFNDLYWDTLGNPNLQPETSYQLEVGQRLKFKNFSAKVIAFYNDIKNMIRWVPNNNGIFNPINTDFVNTYGIETQLEYTTQLQAHKLQVNANYAYTVSENQNTKKQLVYTPFHTAASTVNYSYKSWQIYWQSNYVGQVFTQSDNNPKRVVNPYFIQHLGIEKQLGHTLKLGARIQNLTNTNYQSIANRVMPGINYNFYLNLEI